MSKEKINKLVPKLRFKEFENSEEWASKPFSEMYRLINTNSLSRDQLNYERGSVKNIHYGDIHTKFPTLFNITKETVPFINSNIALDNITTDYFCKESDIVFADASEDLNDVGKSIEIVHLNGEKVFSGMHTILARQREPNLIIGFGGYLFLSKRIRIQVQKEAQGTKVFGVSGSRLGNIEICYPKNKNEQQKITNCLTSLDDLITTENQKLESLKAHKRGLMQNLFPADGETVPTLRFKDFVNSEAWEEKILDQVAHYENGKAHEQDINESGSYVVVNSKFISSDGEIRKYSNKAYCLAEKGDILMVLSDVPNGKAIAKCFFVDSENLYTVNQRVCKMKAHSANSQLLFFILNRNPYFLTFDDGVKQTNLRNDDVLNCPFLLPRNPLEQQKIAACLSSLDELITAQSQKIETLKEHKKGLIQGLFPNISEIK